MPRIFLRCFLSTDSISPRYFVSSCTAPLDRLTNNRIERTLSVLLVSLLRWRTGETVSFLFFAMYYRAFIRWNE